MLGPTGTPITEPAFLESGEGGGEPAEEPASDGQTWHRPGYAGFGGYGVWPQRRRRPRDPRRRRTDRTIAIAGLLIMLIKGEG